MRTTIEMAREAAGDDWKLFQEFMPEIHRLAEFVRADERARMAEQPAQQQTMYLESGGPGYGPAPNQKLIVGYVNKPEQPAQQEQESWEDLHNALQRIDTAAVGLPTFEVRHEGGLDAVTQNIVDAITALHVQPAQQEPVAKVCHDLDGHIGWNPNLRQLPDEGTALYTSPPTLSLAQRPHECSRSHPHENMNAMCELRTEIARLTNENARLKALHQGDEINTYRMTLLCIRDGLQQGMSKSIQKLQAREINDVLGLPSFASYRTFPPAQRTWVGLTDEEIERIFNNWPTYHLDHEEFARAIEAKLKQRNT